MAPPKPKNANPTSSLPAAGIFADMSVDGPVIGTLVAVVDRAKNLPNRKTMGKQNPYCAARLGKEARKTGTDLRGGQTPKWDQELRFTVHESPDYLQLKVSVFNDDKKTELIGETWVDLKSVVIPGGGQSDQWHGLQCKGKYAGDVRMELTYYDTRPKDEAVIGRRKEAERQEAKAEGRQIKHSKDKQNQQQQHPPKRRPLPADPTTGRHPERKPLGPRRDEPLPIPSAAPAQPVPEQQPPQFHRYETPDDLHQQWAPTPQPPMQMPVPMPAPRQQHHQPPQPQQPQHFQQPQQPQQPQQFYDGDVYGDGQQDALPQQPPPEQYQYPPSNQGPMPMPMPHEYSYSPSADDHYEYSPMEQAPNEPHDPYYPENTPYSRDGYEQHPRQMPPQHPMVEQDAPVSHHYDLPAPAAAPHDPYHYSSSHPKPDPYRDGPFRSHQAYRPEPEEDEDEGPPPPPPAHRQGVSQHPQRPPEQRRSEPVTVPQPLNVSPGRTTPTTNGPPADVPHRYIPYSASPESPYQYEPYRGQAYSRDRPPTSGSESAPVPGPSPPATSGPQDYRPDSRQYSAPPPAQPQPPQQQPPQQPPPPQAMRASPASYSSDRPSSSRSNQDLRQIPARKSVSPQPAPSTSSAGGSGTGPGTISNKDSLAGIPFSPDSFDALNPNVSGATAVQQPAAAYSSPAEAMEAARQHEVDKLRELGPIVGNDGRVIDPSDHLPCDTWAPEPEKKSRKPEVVVRFKHANAKGPAARQSSKDPQQTQPPHSQPPSHSLPGPAPRPQSIAGHPAPPPQAAPQPLSKQPQPQPQPQKQPQQIPPSHEAPSQTSTRPGPGRNRLQKRPQSYVPPSDAHYTPPSARGAGPPNGASNTYTPPPPSHHNPHRSSISTSPSSAAESARYSASQHEHGHGHRSARHSYHPHSSAPLNPPPIPAKVPIHSGPGHTDALSEEMRRIDIGQSAGSGSRDSMGRRTGAGRRSFAHGY